METINGLYRAQCIRTTGFPREGRLGLVAQTIAEEAEAWTRRASWISMSTKPAACQRVGELVTGQGAGDAGGIGSHVGPGGVVHAGDGDHVGDGEPAARLEHPGDLAQDLGLSPERLITQLQMTT
jgi:hypothetical protein